MLEKLIVIALGGGAGFLYTRIENVIKKRLKIEQEKHQELVQHDVELYQQGQKILEALNGVLPPA